MDDDIPIGGSHRDEATGFLVWESAEILRDWNVIAEVDDAGPVPLIVALRVLRRDHPGVNTNRAKDIAGGLTARQLRQIHLGRVLQGVNFHLRAWHLTNGEHPRTIAPARTADNETAKAVRAAEYCQAALETRSPRKVLAEAWGMSTTQVRDVVFRLRETGYLEGSRKGQAGATLTEQSLVLLERAGGSAAEIAATYRQASKEA